MVEDNSLVVVLWFLGVLRCGCMIVGIMVNNNGGFGNLGLFEGGGAKFWVFYDYFFCFELCFGNMIFDIWKVDENNNYYYTYHGINNLYELWGSKTWLVVVIIVYIIIPWYV